MDYEVVVEKVINSFKLDHDKEREKAFDACVGYAQKHLRNSQHFAPFLHVAAARLQVRVRMPRED